MFTDLSRNFMKNPETLLTNGMESAILINVDISTLQI